VGHTPGIDPRTPLPDIGSGIISPQRFYEPEFMQREQQSLWPKVWNMGPRLQELAKPGDYVIHTLGRESFVFTRDKNGALKGFYNVCQHRGNRLVQDSIAGNSDFFRCSFHGWSWNNDGSLKGIPQRQDFACFADGLPPGELGLTPVRVDSWGGWLWFNLSQDSPTLLEFLGVIPEHLAPYRLEDMVLYEYKTFLWDCNWKVAVDAFNETYHFRSLHPQMMRWSNDRAQIELLGKHSRMINEYGTTSAPYRQARELFPELQQWMAHYGMDPTSYKGAPADVRLAKQALSRQLQDELSYLPYRDLSDEQLSDVYHYFLFPGFAMNLFAEGINGFRYRPHESDPGKMYYDLIMLVHVADRDQPPSCERGFFMEPAKYDEVADNPVGPLVTEVLQQDADNVAGVQAGVESNGFKGAWFSEQELRLRHFHNTLDEYLQAGEQ
jgi:phenylpropionate dioxygenase-like ring-hydroxylating dioxygenase large terminal subunit